ncbi:MAG: hypothetical protein E7462_02085 [Ruminococcaceae bacterium]|nr:hypothetical protein [Oscillospiraceae bacterium]
MRRQKWIVWLLAVVLLFSGCRLPNLQEINDQLNDLVGNIGAEAAVRFSDMEYTRPDMDRMEADLQACCENAKTETDVQVLLEQVLNFYGLYNSFYTNYNLATIYYFTDMTDSKWEGEYSFCAQNAGTAEAALEELLYALAACPLKDELEKDESFGEGFFDSYVGETLWDETFTSLMNREAVLEEEYYDLCTQAQAVSYYSDAYFQIYGTQMAELYVELIALRQEIAAYAGYADYATFAFEFYHYRDYTPAQAEQYLLDVEKELVPLYKEMVMNQWGGSNRYCSEKETYTYVRSCAEAMGGSIENAFTLMAKSDLYDLTYSDKKYDGSFEVYLMDYQVPYVFVNPTASEQDKLTFAHEFGHFCQDYAGSISCVDIAEVFSQGMEYLSLFYGKNGSGLTQMKLADCLQLYVEQSAFALFEHRVYQLKGDELTVENVLKIYEEVGTAFGFPVWGWDSRDFVLIGHFFTDPMYILSYVVSNDVAFQLYQLEQSQAGKGLELYKKELSTTQIYFLSFVEEAGLESPFAPNRVATVRKTLEQMI